MSLTSEFDDKLVNMVNDERMRVYGHPESHFAKVAALKKELHCDNPELEHVMHMIAVKLARLTVTPEHFDSWLDIAGYARTAVMVMDEQKETKSGF